MILLYMKDLDRNKANRLPSRRPYGRGDWGCEDWVIGGALVNKGENIRGGSGEVFAEYSPKEKKITVGVPGYLDIGDIHAVGILVKENCKEFGIPEEEVQYLYVNGVMSLTESPGEKGEPYIATRAQLQAQFR